MYHIKMSKRVAARCDFLAQNTPKYVYSRGFTTDPLSELTVLPQTPLAGLQGPLRGRSEEGSKGEGSKGNGRK